MRITRPPFNRGELTAPHHDPAPRSTPGWNAQCVLERRGRARRADPGRSRRNVVWVSSESRPGGGRKTVSRLPRSWHDSAVGGRFRDSRSDLRAAVRPSARERRASRGACQGAVPPHGYSSKGGTRTLSAGACALAARSRPWQERWRDDETGRGDLGCRHQCRQRIRRRPRARNRLRRRPGRPEAVPRIADGGIVITAA